MTKEKNYREMRDELDEIMTKLQSGDLDIDEATKQYERGMEIISELEKYLKSAEVKIEKVKAKFTK